MSAYIGKIVSDGRVQADRFFKVVKYADNVEDGLPVLYVGWEKVKGLFGGSISILEKRIGKDAFWTFGRTERRSDNTKDMASFFLYCIRRCLNNVEYRYFNVLTVPFSQVRRLLELVDEQRDKFVFVDENRFIYIYAPYMGKVYGVSLDALRYMGVKVEKAVERAERNPFNYVRKDDTFLSFRLRMMIGDNRMVIPVLLSLDKSITVHENLI